MSANPSELFVGSLGVQALRATASERLSTRIALGRVVWDTREWHGFWLWMCHSRLDVPLRTAIADSSLQPNDKAQSANWVG